MIGNDIKATEVPVFVTTLTIGSRKITPAIFKQIQTRNPMKARDIKQQEVLPFKILGSHRYSLDKNDTDLHYIWQYGGALYLSSIPKYDYSDGHEEMLVELKERDKHLQRMISDGEHMSTQKITTSSMATIIDNWYGWGSRLEGIIIPPNVKEAVDAIKDAFTTINETAQFTDLGKMYSKHFSDFEKAVGQVPAAAALVATDIPRLGEELSIYGHEYQLEAKALRDYAKRLLKKNYREIRSAPQILIGL